MTEKIVYRPEKPSVLICIQHKLRRAKCCYNCYYSGAKQGCVFYQCNHPSNDESFAIEHSMVCNRFKDLEYIPGLDYIPDKYKD